MQAHAVAWTKRAVRVRFGAPPHQHEVWVWAGAVERDLTAIPVTPSADQKPQPLAGCRWCPLRFCQVKRGSAKPLS